MAENLKVTHYNNGDEIPNITNNGDWGSYVEGQYGVYDNDPANADIYGNLYNFAVVDDDRGVCPDGFHVPSDEEIMELEMFLGMSEQAAYSEQWRGTDEGSKLAGNSDLWDDGDLENNSEFGTSGFNIIPAGYRFYTNGYYGSMGLSGLFWSSSESNSGFAWRRSLNFNYSDVLRVTYLKLSGFSIRCLQDEITTGCTDPDACNYDETATDDDGSCAYEYDCAGTCGGDLEPDCCGACGGDNSQCSNCCGMPFPDDCSGVCCSEVCYFDVCGVCDDIPENDCVQDCAGTWGGTSVDDVCGVCGGSTTDVTLCDCSEGIDMDCTGECGGTAVVDDCGICGGEQNDGDIDNDGDICEYLDIEATLSFGEVDLASQTIEIHLANSAPVSGFQFLLSSDDSVDFVDAYGGSAEENGFTVELGGNNIVLGFSLSATEIPTGSDVLTIVEFDGFTSNEICLSEGVITSGYEDAQYLDVSYGDCISLYSKGDVNMDGVLDVLDIVTIVNIIFETIDPDEYEVWASDYNSDGEINIMDIVQIVNAIFSDDVIIEGCMDDGYQQWSPYPGSPACNYNPDANVEGDCEYFDECGVCGGDGSSCDLCDGLTEVELWGQYYDIGTTSINLNSQGLTGSIPPEIGCLTNLTYLNLHYNQLTGEIPSEIGNLTNLTHLFLPNNQLTGEMPSWIGNLTNLIFLSLYANQLTGEIPSEIGNLTNLTDLYLSYNQLTGEIPSEIGNLTNLTILHLNDNLLTGYIPSEIGSLTNLTYLHLSSNLLTGEIPPEVCDLIESNNLNMDNILNGNNLINTCD